MFHQKRIKIIIKNLREIKKSCFEEQNKCCFYCLDELVYSKATRDHKVPQIKNGLNIKENIVISCRECNQIKGSFDFDKFYGWIVNPKAPKIESVKSLDRKFNILRIWSRRRMNIAINKLKWSN